MQNIEIKTLTQYRNPNGEELVRQQIKLKNSNKISRQNRK
jgi:hypothetical protein